jgi:hypothetical protein
MDIRLIKFAIALVLPAVAPLFLAPTAQADVLEGQTVKTTLGVYFGTLIFSETSGEVVVGPGTEITDFDFSSLGGPLNHHVDIDLSDTNILITNREGEFDCPAFCYLRFEDAYGTIPRFTGVTINPATTWPGYDSIRFTANSIDLDLHGGFPGATLSLDITAIIPEPATLVTGLLGCVSLLAFRRSRNQLFEISI